MIIIINRVISVCAPGPVQMLRHPWLTVCTRRKDRRASIGGLLTCSLAARASQFIGKPLSFACRGGLEGKGCREQDVKVCTWWIEASLIARIIDPIRVHIRAHKQKAYKKGWLCYLLSKIVFLPNNTLPSISQNISMLIIYIDILHQ